jgi:riboflavin biosynthesis pyrimidine reductase
MGLDDLYTGLTLPTGDPGQDAWVALCMVSSLDGAAAVDGLSGGLGGEADRLALQRLRASHDVTLVGAGTVRDEGYGPMGGSEDRRADRVRRGLAPVARLAIVTRSGRLDPDLRVFSDPAQLPLVLTSAAADAEALERLDGRADIHVLGDDTLDGPTIIEHLAAAGLRRIVCEGGPSLNQALLSADLVDELFLTLAPVLVGGEAPRIIGGPDGDADRTFRPVSILEHEGDLLVRYRHARHRPE